MIGSGSRVVPLGHGRWCEGNSSRGEVIKGPALPPHLDRKAHLKQVPVPRQTPTTMGSHSSRVLLREGLSFPRVEATALLTVTPMNETQNCW